MFEQALAWIFAHMTDILLAAISALLILGLRMARMAVVKFKDFAVKFAEEAKKTPSKTDDVEGVLLTALATALLAAMQKELPGETKTSAKQ